MNSRADSEFWKRFAALPSSVRVQARSDYAAFVDDPWGRAFDFKRVHKTPEIWSIRIGRSY